MFYNTKVGHFFNTASTIGQKSMFYNTFLDLRQLILKSLHAKKGKQGTFRQNQKRPIQKERDTLTHPAPYIPYYIDSRRLLFRGLFQGCH